MKQFEPLERIRFPKVVKMHGKCNSCDKKMFMIGIQNGERKTHRYNSNSTACFYGWKGQTRIVWIKSPCCKSLIRRAKATGFKDVKQYVQC